MEQFLENNSIYLVLLISLMLWFGFAIYLFIIDNRLKKFEKILGDDETQTKTEN